MRSGSGCGHAGACARPPHHPPAAAWCCSRLSGRHQADAPISGVCGCCSPAGQGCLVSWLVVSGSFGPPLTYSAAICCSDCLSSVKQASEPISGAHQRVSTSNEQSDQGESVGVHARSQDAGLAAGAWISGCTVPAGHCTSVPAGCNVTAGGRLSAETPQTASAACTQLPTCR